MPVQIDPRTLEKVGPIRYRDSDHSYYDDDGNRMRSITNVAKIPTDTFNLNLWDKRMVAKGLAKHPELIEDVAAYWDDNARLNEICTKAKEWAGADEGSRRGTQAHAASERHDLDQPLITAQQEWDAGVWGRTLERYGIEIDPELVEKILYYPQHRICGRMDRFARFRHARKSLNTFDIKTGSSAVRYPHATAVQLSLQVMAPLIEAERRYEGDQIVVTKWMPMPPDMRTDIGYVLLQPTRDSGMDIGTLYEFKLDGELNGHDGARAAIIARHFQLNNNLCRPIEAPMPVAPRESNVIALPSLDPVTMQATLRAQIDLLNDNERALARMAWQPQWGSIREQMTVEAILEAKAMVDTVDGFQRVSDVPQAPVIEVAGEPPPRWKPNEGELMPVALGGTLQTAYEAADDRVRAAVNDLCASAIQHNCSFHVGQDFIQFGTTTERRYWLILAVMTLAANDSIDADEVRYLAASVVDADWPFDSRLRPGAVVGLLGVEHAEAFCDLALRLIAGELVVDGNRLQTIPNDDA